MLRFFRRLPLPVKLFLIVCIPLAMLIFMLVQIYQEKTQKVDLLSNYIETIRQSGTINFLIEGLQKERKFSFDYAMRKERPAELTPQRLRTDSTIVQLEKGRLAGFTTYTFLDKLSQARSQVDSEKIIPEQVMQYYNTAMYRVNTLNVVPPGTDVYLKPIHSDLVAEKLLSEMIINLGIIRSYVYNVLYTKNRVEETLASMTSLYDLFKTYETEFLQKSSLTTTDAYNSIKRNSTLSPTLNYMDSLVQHFYFDSTYNAATWWKLSENGMEQLRTLQRGISENVNVNAKSILEKERKNRNKTMIFLIVILASIVLFIVSTTYGIIRILHKMNSIARTNEEVNDELAKMAEKYKTIFYKSPLPKFIYDYESLQFLEVNEAALKHYGYSNAEFISMNIKDIRPPEDIDKLHRDIEIIKSGEESPYKYWRHLKKNGEIITVEVMAHFIDYNGRLARMVIVNDVTEKLKAETALQESHEALRELASHLQNIREEERASMAREVHDVLGQQITCIKMDVSWLSRQLNAEDPKIKRRIQELTTLLDETAVVVRKIASALRPSILDDFGLADALEWQSRDFENRSGIKVHFQSDLPAGITIPKDITTGLFRITQESLTNVGRHAEATEVNINIGLKDDQLLLTIADNGKGFDVAKSGERKTLGLLGMKERTLMIDGKYEIDSTPGKGTIVKVTVPIKLKT